MNCTVIQARRLRKNDCGSVKTISTCAPIRTTAAFSFICTMEEVMDKFRYLFLFIKNEIQKNITELKNSFRINY
jgi:hypothetical protein